jgi:cell division protein FtsB
LASAENTTRKKIRNITLVFLGVVGIIVLWVGFGDQGLIRLYRADKEHQAYVDRIKILTDENKLLMDEIKRLRSDRKYVESVIKKDFNLVRSNEIIYRFGDEEPQEDDQTTLPGKVQQDGSKVKPEREKLHHEDTE